MDPVQEEAPKVPKFNQEQQKQVDLEMKAMLEKRSISKVSLKKRILQQFVSDQQKRRQKPSSHKFEGSESVHICCKIGITCAK